MFYSFYDYWKQFGKYHHEVISNPEMEKIFLDFAQKIWNDAEGTSEETYDIGHSDGWDECEEYYKIPEEKKC